MKRTWKRFAVLAGCAAWSLMGSSLLADPHRPASAYSCPYLEREKCERAASKLAQSEPSPDELGAAQEAAPVDEVPATTSPESQTVEPQQVEVPAAPVAVSEEAATNVAADLSSAWEEESGAGNILVFELNSENEGLEAAPLIEIDYEAQVAREALGDSQGASAKALSKDAAVALDPAPAPPAELTDAAPVVAEVESAPVVEAAPVERKTDEWGYARFLAGELYGEVHRLAIHEAAALVMAAGGSLENVRLIDQVASDEASETVPASEEARAIEVVAEPESQAAPVSTEIAPAAASPAESTLDTSVGEEPAGQEAPATSLESNLEVDPESAVEPQTATPAPEAVSAEEASQESTDESVPAGQSESYLPETLEDFGNKYAFPELEV